MADYIPPDGDWQSKKSVISCNRHMWTHQLACDVTFIVGDGRARIQAHKYMLISRSSVFFAMFAGLLSGNTGNEVEVPDIGEESFNSLMTFIYCEDVTVDASNVMALLYASKKYGVQGLIDKCLNVLKKAMNVSDIATILECAHMYGDDNLKEKCLTLIAQNTLGVLQSDTLVELCSECLCTIIKDDSVSVNEEDIFNAILKYADQKCEKTGKEKTPENRRAVLGDVVNHIRYPLMTPEYFTDVVESSGVLTEDQVLKMFRYLLKRQKDNATPCPDGFIGKERNSVYILERFQTTASGWGYKRDNSDAITFECSKDIMLKGLQVYGSCQGPNALKVKLKLVQEPYGAIVTSKNFEIGTDGIQKTYDIYFEEPKKILKDKKFTLILTFYGPTTFYGSQGQEEIVTDKLVVKFSKAKKSTNNTSPERGQIPALIYELCPAAEAMDTSTPV